MITEDLLMVRGSPCSKCGQALSSQNPPLIEELPNLTFKGKPVSQAICRNPPYVQVHTQMVKDITLKIVYQSTPTGYIEIMAKDLDTK